MKLCCAAQDIHMLRNVKMRDLGKILIRHVRCGLDKETSVVFPHSSLLSTLYTAKYPYHGGQIYA